MEPCHHELALLGLGRSVGTPPTGITAEVFVVSSFDDLKANSSKAAGKIVLFNAGEMLYDLSSFLTFVSYDSDVKKIPTAAITIEDAEMLACMQARGTKIKVKLYMEATTREPCTSRNVIAEVVEAQNPEEIVLLGGYSDSWDVGQGDTSCLKSCT